MYASVPVFSSCKLMRSFHSFLMEHPYLPAGAWAGLQNGFSSWADFLPLVSSGCSTEVLTRQEGKLCKHLYPRTFAIYLTLKFCLRSHVFPFCCPIWLQVGRRYHSQHLPCWQWWRQQPPCWYSNKNAAVMKRILLRWRQFVWCLLKCHKFVLPFRHMYLRIQFPLFHKKNTKTLEVILLEGPESIT